MHHKRDVTELFADVGWRVYVKMMSIPLFLGRIRYRDPQKRLNMILRFFLRYVFNEPEDAEDYLPGYKRKYWAEENSYRTDWFNCPPFNYFKEKGTEEEKTFFYETWCQYDYAIPQLVSKDGYYERPHTLSLGDDICDMRWSTSSKELATSD